MCPFAASRPIASPGAGWTAPTPHALPPACRRVFDAFTADRLVAVEIYLLHGKPRRRGCAAGCPLRVRLRATVANETWDEFRCALRYGPAGRRWLRRWLPGQGR